MPVNVALLGSGLFATNSYLPALSDPRNSHIKIHTLWSRSEASVSKLAAKSSELGHSPRVLHGDDGLQTVWDDREIDAVLLVLPITAQKAFVEQAWKHGKHVMSEKPIAKDCETARAMIEEYEAQWAPKGLIWRIAENYEHDELIRKAGELLRNEESIGPVLYWQLRSEACVPDGSAYQSTTWRTIPEYQGGFLLDGGVHNTSMLRTVLPTPPASIIATSNLHRAHLVPHDIVQGLGLPPSESATDAHGPATQVKALNTIGDIPGGIGKSSPTGTILLSFALPDTPPESRAPQGLTVTCLNAVVSITNMARVWTLRVIPAAGSKVKDVEETSKATGVEQELAMFARAIQATKEGKQVDGSEALGSPRGTLWDLAIIEAMLKSNGEKVDLDKLVGSV